MKILYSCPLDPIKNGAPGHHVSSVVRELAARSHSVSLIHQGGRLPDINAFRQYALALKRYRFVGRIFCDIQYAYALLKILGNDEYDCVYHRFEKFSVLPLILFKLFRKPTILELNADNRSELKSLDANVIARKLYPLSEYMQVKLASKIVVVSEGIGENLKKNIPSIWQKIVVIENGADIQTYFPRDRDRACEALDLDPNKKYVTFSGSFQPWQGLDCLISAARDIISEVPEVHFILVGDGICRATLEKLIQQENLESAFLLTGWMEPQNVAEYIAASEICVAPYSRLAAIDLSVVNANLNKSLMKCSPLKIYTYMAMGKPTVASGFLDGGRRLVEWGTGLAFTPGSATELAASLITLLKDKTLSDRMGVEAASRARKHHSWAAVAKKIDQTCIVKFCASQR